EVMVASHGIADDIDDLGTQRGHRLRFPRMVARKLLLERFEEAIASPLGARLADQMRAGVVEDVAAVQRVMVAEDGPGKVVRDRARGLAAEPWRYGAHPEGAERREQGDSWVADQAAHVHLVAATARRGELRREREAALAQPKGARYRERPAMQPAIAPRGR